MKVVIFRPRMSSFHSCWNQKVSKIFFFLISMGLCEIICNLVHTLNSYFIAIRVLNAHYSEAIQPCLIMFRRLRLSASESAERALPWTWCCGVDKNYQSPFKISSSPLLGPHTFISNLKFKSLTIQVDPLFQHAVAQLNLSRSTRQIGTFIYQRPQPRTWNFP